MHSLDRGSPLRRTSRPSSRPSAAKPSASPLRRWGCTTTRTIPTHSSSTIACACGQTAHYAGRRPKTFTTLLGPLTLHRAYYHCAACHAGMCPRDRALSLHDTSLSPATTRLVGLTATKVSFVEASELMEIGRAHV